MIELKRPINTIKARFGQKTRVVGGGEVEPWGADDEDEEVPQSNIVRRNSTPGGTQREAPLTEGPSARRHSMPHSSRSLTASPERRVARSISAEEKTVQEDSGAACLSTCQGITITCEDTSDDLVEKLHNEIEKNCHLLDPDFDTMRGRRSRSSTPTPFDTIPEDAADKAREAGQRGAAADKTRVGAPPGGTSEAP